MFNKAHTMIQSGQKIPAVQVKLINNSGALDADTGLVFQQGKIAYFTLPGAFTPTCHSNHLPGYIAAADELRAQGIDRIICGTVNDQHVVKAWAEQSGALRAIEFIADGNGAFTKAIGLDKDMSGGGMGIRSIRAALIVKDGIVDSLFTEDKPGLVTSSGAPAILEVLKAGSV